LTLTRLLRLIVATLFLATATFSAVANAHGLCEENSGYQQSDHNHQHPGGNADLDPSVDISKKNDSSSLAGDMSSDVTTVCHSGAGCPGCTTPADQPLHAPVAAALAFRHASETGESADQSSSLRPPKIS